MNKKYFLKGLGSGLILAAIAFIAGISIGTDATDTTANEETTEVVVAEATTEEATEAATEEVVEATEEATEDVTEEVAEEAAEEATEEEVTEEATEEVTTEEATTEEATTEEVTTEEATTEATKGGSVTVKAGNSCMTVAKKLHNIGVIDDEEDFYMYMYNNGYSTKILQGTFTFTGDETYEEIAKILMMKN